MPRNLLSFARGGFPFLSDTNTHNAAEEAKCSVCVYRGSAHKRFVQVFVDFFQETHGRQPGLFGADQERQVFGHVAGFDGFHDDAKSKAR